jgi:biopolymer transport protein ExbD
MPVQIDKGKALDALNLTPLIDVVFLLLIFFLVATRFSEEEREIDIDMAKASEAKPLIVKPNDLIVNVTKRGEYYVSGKVVNEAGLEKALRQSWADNLGRQQVIIRADKESKTKHLAVVMNLCNKVDIRNYTLATEE